MKFYIREHLKLLLGIILVILFFIFRITLVYLGGPHDLWTELISSISFLIGLISGCLIISDSKVKYNKSKIENILELQNDEYNFGHNVDHEVGRYID